MNKLTSILAIADPAMTLSAGLKRAIELARAAKAKLRIVLFDYSNLIERTGDLVSPEVMKLARDQFESRRNAWLASIAAPLAAEGVPVECEFVWTDSLYEGVVAKCLQYRPDLVVKDAPTDSKGRIWRRNTTGRNVMRFCPSPLWLVSRDHGAIKKIVAGVDTASMAGESPAFNRHIVAEALTIGLYTGAEVHVAHAFPHDKRTIVTNRTLRDLYAELKSDDQADFAAFCDQQQVPADRRHFLEGQPPAKLAAFMGRQGAELLVIGSSYKSGFDRLMMGSTSEAVSERAPFDVLLLKPATFKEDLAKHLDLPAICRRHEVETVAEAPAKSAIPDIVSAYLAAA